MSPLFAIKSKRSPKTLEYKLRKGLLFDHVPLDQLDLNALALEPVDALGDTVFAAFEFARMNLIRHTVDVAAYEGARAGVLPGATSSSVQSRVNTALAAAGVNSATIQVEPSTIRRSTDQVTVRVAVPLDDHTWVPSRFLGGATANASCTLRRERY